MRNLAGGAVSAAHFGRPHRELRSARRLVVGPGPAGLAAAWPSGSSGTLHTCGTGVLFGSSVRRLEARTCPVALQTSLANFACNSPATISNSEFTALKSQRF